MGFLLIFVTRIGFSKFYNDDFSLINGTEDSYKEKGVGGLIEKEKAVEKDGKGNKKRRGKKHKGWKDAELITVGLLRGGVRGHRR